ncbi:MAG: beta-ketoacyl-[acyl-carrier-protein] synthase family protein [Gammaproteobacteria bacterium]|nr:beta-ketoacyl-[acyl-carrier-protein] synthase family protein [Gammaproteobacteria bacterium]
MKPLRITAYTVTNALGRGVAASLGALRNEESGLRPCDFEDADLPTWIGRVAGLEEESLTGAFAAFDCRNNRLARLALEQDGFSATVRQARDRYGAERIGVFIGTSTSGIGATEHAYRERDPATGCLPETFDYRHTHNLFSATDLTRQWLGLSGVALAVSTACSSSAKVFASAFRHINAGFCDAAVVGGVDSLCLTTLYGFNALGLASTQVCRPWDSARAGLNVGEAAGFALLESAEPGDGRLRLLGYGESSDAYHMTAAHPEGVGAALAMEQALARAGLPPEQVDYINLHGTATLLNDAAEDKAMLRIFGPDTPCSSTKGWTGHTLGAAGMTEAAFAWLCLEHGFIPGTLNTRQRDPNLGAGVVLHNREQTVRIVMSNSFGFGGTNCSLLFGWEQDASPCAREHQGEGVA